MQRVISRHSKRMSAEAFPAGNTLELAAGGTTAGARTRAREKRTPTLRLKPRPAKSI